MTRISPLRDHTSGVIPSIDLGQGDTWRPLLHRVEFMGEARSGIEERPLTPPPGEGEDPPEHGKQVVEDASVHVNMGEGGDAGVM